MGECSGGKRSGRPLNALARLKAPRPGLGMRVPGKGKRSNAQELCNVPGSKKQKGEILTQYLFANDKSAFMVLTNTPSLEQYIALRQIPIWPDNLGISKGVGA